jgi:hypothetical protein
MFSYRITKYNPAYRNSLGSYLKDDWTAISDIGKIYKNQKFTIDEYLKVEDRYIEVILLFMIFLNLKSLYITYLEKNNTILDNKNIPYSSSMLELYEKISVGKQINIKEVSDIARLVLRELLWCKLENKNMFVHFGDDYYMYIGTSKEISESLKKKIESLNLFVEQFSSPYL